MEKQEAEDRHGFRVPTRKEKKKEAAEDPEDCHPAWSDFKAAHHPAVSKAEATLLITTTQLLERLNSACECVYFDEEWLYNTMKDAGYKQYQVPGTAVCWWMIRNL